MVTWTCAWLLALGATPNAASSPSAAAEPPAAAIVVRPHDWAGALTEWKAYRAAQGHAIIEIDSELGPSSIHSRITELARAANERREKDPRASKIGYVVLIGDGNRDAEQAPTLPAWYRPSTAMVRLGGDKELATDNPYGDLDNDESPDLAVGRVPADTPEAARQFLARSIAYERQSNFGKWRRDVRVVAGVGGFGPLADSVIEMTTSRFLTDRVPPWANVAMTYASPNSPYCPDPFRFSEATVDQLNAGSMFWVYVGHGHVKHLDYLHVDRDVLGIFTDSQISRVRTAGRSPIAVFLACYTGAYDAREDCLAEQLVMSSQGPVAALAATRVTGPYGLASLASGMLDQCYVHHAPSLGDAILRAKQQMLIPEAAAHADNAPGDDSRASDSQGKANGGSPLRTIELTQAASAPRQPEPAPKPDAQMQLITAIASALSPAGHDLPAERREHVWQMNLLGDPMLRLEHPAPVEVSVTPRIAAGETISVNGKVGQAGRVSVELARPRDKTPRDLFVAGKFSTDARVREKMQATYAQANQRILLGQSLELAAPGTFACDLKTPADLPPGRYLVRVFVEGNDSWSAGSAQVNVRPPTKSE